MKRVININFQGRVIPIEESAYDILKRYVESLNVYFSNEEGKDEIINDIESRIAELFGESLKKGSTCISDDDVEKIIDSMGRPADFEEQSGNSGTTAEPKASSQTKSEQYYQQTDGPKRLYRDENNKVLGGVCSGIANYFGIDPVIVRIITVICSGILFVPYIIFWVAVPNSATTVIGAPRKRLFRDMDEKVIAGVCSGFAHYFGISVWIPRVLFLLPFISFAFHFTHMGWWGFPHFFNISVSPGSVVIYVILWMVIPEAITTADKLEMRGEKVDLNNIKNTIQTDMGNFFKKAEQSGKGFSKKANEWGKEFSDKAQEWSTEFSETVKEKGHQFSSEMAAQRRQNRGGLGNAIATLFKVFAYFITGVVLLTVLCALFALGIAFTGLMPLKDFVLTGQWDNLYAWGALILFIWVPVVGIITFAIRKIARIKAGSKLLRYSFLSLWLVGLFCAVSLLVSVFSNFRYNNRAIEENINLSNAKVNKLEVMVQPHSKFMSRDRWFKFEPFAQIDEDTAFVQNVRIKIVKGLTDSFQVRMIKFAKGSSKNKADFIARNIEYNIVQKDSSLILDRGIMITPQNKFHNQSILLTIEVPVGKRIKINNNARFGNCQFNVNFDDEDIWNYSNDEDKSEEWKQGVEYIMTEKGLRRTDAREEDLINNDNDQQVLDEFRRNKDEMKRKREEKIRELKELDKELKDVDSLELKQKEPVKTDKQKSNLTTSVSNDSIHRQSSAASNSNTVMMRFTI